MRSWMIVPADKEGAASQAATAGADAIVIDLARAMSADRKESVRLVARNWLASHREQVVATRRFERWVRIGPVRTPHWREDLAAALDARADGVVLAECVGPDDIQQLASYLYECEGRYGIPANSLPIVPELAPVPRSALSLNALSEAMHPRVAALMWDATGLARSLGARRLRGPGGLWIDPLAYARANVLLIAHANGLGAIEAPFSGSKDEDLERFARAARADGFTGMAATRRAQIAGINAAFEPSDEDRAEAREIVGLFSLNPSAETVAFRGRWIGQAELAHARRVLGDAG